MFKQLVTICDSTSMTNFIVAGKRTQLPVNALPNPWGPQCDKIRPVVMYVKFKFDYSNYNHSQLKSMLLSQLKYQRN